MFFKMSFLNKLGKSLKNVRKGVLLLSKTYPKLWEYITCVIPNVYALSIKLDGHKPILI